MSFADPTSWTDVDAGGNPLDWSTRDNKLLYPGYEMIRKAIVERCALTGVAVPVDLIERTDGTIYDHWLAAAQSTVTLLIPYFINSEDHGGDWDGSATQPPALSEASLMTEIGEARLSTGIPLAAWSKQQYEILRRLIWTSKAITSSTAKFHKLGYSGWAASWAAAVAAATAAFNGASKSAQGPAYWEVGSYCRGENHAHAPPYTAVLGAAEAQWIVGGIQNVIAHEADFYFYSTMFPSAYVFTYETFDDNGLGYAEDTYNKLQTFAVATTDTHTANKVGDADSAMVAGTDPSNVTETSFRGWYCDPAYYWCGCVLRWNVTGGFQFKDS
ncbi:MAG: hypothetical protein GY851_35345 [bacterium]|nr:hypothetical protein [bacterium]